MNTIFYFLSVPWLNGIGVVIGIFGIIAAYIFYRLAKLESRLSFQSRGIRLIDKNIKVFPEEIKISFKNKEITRLAKTFIILWNSGNKTITGSSIVNTDKLRIVFGSDTQILDCSIIKKTRECNKVNVRKDTNSPQELIISFDYLDVRDGIALEIIHTDTRKPILKGSMREMPQGIRDEGIIQPKRPRGYVIHIVVFAILCSLFLLGLIFPNTIPMLSNKNNGTPEQKMGIIIFVSLMLVQNLIELFRLRQPYPRALSIEEII